MSPDSSPKPASWPAILFNWIIAFLFLTLICTFSFAQLRYNWNWGVLVKYQNFFWRGWFKTLEISSISLVLSTMIGFLAAVAGRSSLLFLRALTRIYIELIRGIPLLVQVSFAFYVIADAIHFGSRLAVGIFTLSLFSGAFISEIIRGGIGSVGATQLESARAVGFTKWQTYQYVILPQAVRVILPGLAGMFVSLIKDSSLLSIISIEDFTWNAQQVASLTYSNFECYVPLAFGYLVLTLPITIWIKWLEGRLHFET
ncbi:MAG: amino acid ABC transporter permease [Verrucomicrobia bacterium]|nr:amino acid ABC transporter permease [Verrucomicrobiota bacterium]